MHVITSRLNSGTRSMYVAALNNTDMKSVFVNLIVYAHFVSQLMMSGYATVYKLRRTDTHFHITDLINVGYDGPFRTTRGIPRQIDIVTHIHGGGSDLQIVVQMQKHPQKTFANALQLLMPYLDTESMTVPVFELIESKHQPTPKSAYASQFHLPTFKPDEQRTFYKPHINCIRLSVDDISENGWKKHPLRWNHNPKGVDYPNVTWMGPLRDNPLGWDRSQMRHALPRR